MEEQVKEPMTYSHSTRDIFDCTGRNITKIVTDHSNLPMIPDLAPTKSEELQERREQVAKDLQQQVFALCISHTKNGIKDAEAARFALLNKDKFDSKYKKYYGNSIGCPRTSPFTILMLEEVRFSRQAFSSDKALLEDMPKLMPALHAALGGEKDKPLMARNTLGNGRRYMKEAEHDSQDEQGIGIDMRQDYFELRTRYHRILTAMNPDIRRGDSTDIEGFSRRLTRDQVIQIVLQILMNAAVKTSSKPIPEEWKILLSKQCPMRDIGLEQALGYAHTLSSQTNISTEDDRETAVLLEVGLAMRDHYSPEEKIRSTQAYEVLSRLLGEQTEEDDQGNLVMRLKLAASSLQTPYDLQATYRKKRDKKWIGYVLYVMEERDDQKNLSQIVYMDVQRNTTSDVELEKRRLDRLKEQEEEITTLVDGGFYSGPLIEEGLKTNTRYHFTDMTGSKGDPDQLSADLFGYSEAGEITQCPAGKTPERSIFKPDPSPGKGASVAHFSPEACQGCALADRCRGSVGKKGQRTIRISKITRHAAETKRDLKDPKYIEEGRRRAAIEGLISTLKNNYGAGDIRVRGLWRVGGVVMAQCLAYNSSQVANYLLEQLVAR